MSSETQRQALYQKDEDNGSTGFEAREKIHPEQPASDPNPKNHEVCRVSDLRLFGAPRNRPVFRNGH